MASKLPYIQGCKASSNNRGLVTPSGVPAIDALLNGGLTVGSLCLFMDEVGSYSQYFATCFAAEGLTSSQSVYTAGYYADHQLFSENLPALCEEYPKNTSLVSPSISNSDILDDNSSIAWRYKNLQAVNASVQQQNCSDARSFSRRKLMDKSVLTEYDFSEYVSDFSLSICHCEEVLRSLKQKLDDDKYDLASTRPKKLLRIVLTNLGSPLWNGNGKILHFIFALKCLIRDKAAIVLLTFSSNAIRSDVAKRIMHHCDVALKLKALFKRKSANINKFYEGYKGLIFLEKLPLINSLNFSVPECLDLAFKWKKDCFVIEKLHTPPEIDESMNNQSSALYNKPLVSTIGCASNLEHAKLDF